MFSNIRHLLFSSKPEDVNLALEIMEGQGLVEQMRTDLFLVYTFRNYSFPPHEHIGKLLGKTAGQYRSILRLASDLDKLASMARQPGLDHAAILQFGARNGKMEGPNTWFLERANEEQLRQWLPATLKIDLADQKLPEFPPALRQITELQSLKLNHNHIRQVPKWLPELAMLRHLDLGSNEIRQPAAEIADLFLLERLRLSSSPLSSLAGIAKAAAIRDLAIDNCQDLQNRDLRHLPPGLERLDLHNSNGMDADCFSLLPPSLRELVFGNYGDLAKAAILDARTVGRLPASLEKLEIRRANFPGKDALEALPAGLKDLQLQSITGLSPNFFSRIPAGIQHFSCWNTDLPIRALYKIPQALISLRIHDQGQQVLDKLTHLPRSLEVLELNEVSVLECKLTHELPAMQKLEISGYEVAINSKAILAYVSHMPALKEIKVPAGMEQNIKSQVPHLKVNER